MGRDGQYVSSWNSLSPVPGTIFTDPVMVWATPRPRSAEVWHDRATSSCSWATPPQWSASVQLHETDPVKLSSLWRCLTKIKLRMNGSSPALDEHLGICVFQSKGICWYCFKFNFQVLDSGSRWSGSSWYKIGRAKPGLPSGTWTLMMKRSKN